MTDIVLDTMESQLDTIKGKPDSMNTDIDLINLDLNTAINLIYQTVDTRTDVYCDTPEPWGLFFQDNATPQMEGLEELHNNIMFYLAAILFAVTWIIISIM